MTRRIWRATILLSLLAASLIALSWGLRVFYRSAYPVTYYETVLTESKSQGIDPALVFAVIRTESNFRPEVQSSIGARGLMQITEETFDWIVYRTGFEGHSFNDLYDPHINIQYGAALLRLLADEFDTQVNSLCAYHAGWGSVKRWLANPETAPDGATLLAIPFGDTARYVRKVEATQNAYSGLYGL